METLDKLRSRLTLIIVVATALTCSFLVWRIVRPSFFVLHRPEFEACWIRHPDPSHTSVYFRKEFHLSAPVKTAYLRILGTETLAVYVNGAFQGTRVFASNNIYSQLDVTPLMRRGKNVIAVHVKRPSFDTFPRVAAELWYEDFFNNTKKIFTDSSWRVESREFSHITQTRMSFWYDLAYADVNWLWALSGSPPATAETPFLNQSKNKALLSDRWELSTAYMNPGIFSVPTQGEWFWSARNPEQVLVEQTLQLDPDFREVWIRVAATGFYDLAVNGIPLLTEMRRSDIALCHLTPYLHGGSNRITILSYSELMPRALFADMLVVTPGGPHWIPSGLSWRSTPQSGLPAPGPTVTVPEPELNLDKRFKKHQPIPLPLRVRMVLLRRAAQWTAGILAIVLLGWVGSSELISRLGRCDRSQARRLDGFLHLPVLLSMAGLLVLRYDVRMNPLWPFQIKFVVALALIWIGARMILYAELVSRRSRNGPSLLTAEPLTDEKRSERIPAWLRDAMVVVLLSGLFVAGYWLRLRLIFKTSFWHDEVEHARLALGILKTLIPSYELLPGMTVYADVNQLFCYPMLPFIKIFGMNELGIRFSSLFFALLTILCIYYVGRRWFGTGAGLLAAALFTFSPMAIYWVKGQYPQQVQFFALLTVYCYYLAIVQSSKIVPKWIYVSIILIFCTSFSWQGAIFLLFGMFAVTVVFHQLRFLGEKAMWYFAIIIPCVIFIALLYFSLINELIPPVHEGFRSLIKGTNSAKNHLEAWFRPLWYVTNLMLCEHHQVLFVPFMAGILAWKSSKSLRYSYTVLFGTLLALTYMNPRQVSHYLYFLLPLYLLIAAGSLFVLMDSFRPVWGRALTGRVTHHATLAVAALLLMVSGNRLWARLDNLPFLADTWGGWLTSRGADTQIHYTPHLRPLAEAMLPELEPDDVIIASHVSPLALDHYLGKWGRVDYIYNITGIPGMEWVNIMDDNETLMMRLGSGTEAVRDPNHFRDILKCNPRVWLVTSFPWHRVMEKDPFKNYIIRNMVLKKETYSTQVFLKEM